MHFIYVCLLTAGTVSCIYSVGENLFSELPQNWLLDGESLNLALYSRMQSVNRKIKEVLLNYTRLHRNILLSHYFINIYSRTVL